MITLCVALGFQKAVTKWEHDGIRNGANANVRFLYNVTLVWEDQSFNLFANSAKAASPRLKAR